MLTEFRILGRPLSQSRIAGKKPNRAMNFSEILAWKIETPTNISVIMENNDVLDFKFQYRETTEQFVDLLIRNDLRNLC